MGQKVSRIQPALQHHLPAVKTCKAAIPKVRMPLKSLSSAPLVWIDVETTGLVPEKDVMLEIAMVITDGNLDQLGQPQSLVISQPPEQLRKLNAWSKNCHTKSGLLDDVAKSSLTLQQAESVLMEQVTKYCKRPNKAVLAGNNVGFDRAFISRYMPVLSGYLHFRNIDVSSVNELAKRWRPDVVSQYKKTYSHRAMDDINESIRELKHYQDTIFRR